MHPTVDKLSGRARTMLLGTTVLAELGMAAAAVAPAFAQDAGAMETVVVTGYRASLTDSTNAKRASVGFSDTVFAEDIGKFPDTNIAEAFNRIPGITITREVEGEGLQIAVRGLGTNFTKVLLNNAPVAIASTGRTDAQGTNREVDLNMFPTELFTQLTVSKSPTADMIEGGTSGTVNMRSMRPFDNPGMHLTYSLQGQMGSVAGKLGEKATLIASDTEGPFGILVGATLSHSLVRTTGFETIGWTNPGLTAAQCGAGNTCNQTGGDNWTIPAVAPTNASTIAAGIAGDTINAAWLLAHNPGLTTAQISNALLPRLGRPADQWGHRDRGNAILSLEYRPSDALHFFVDAIAGRLVNDEHRTDMMFQVRSTSIIPMNQKVDANNVVTSGTYANVNMFLEDRPYTEKEDFFSINPGMDWQATELLNIKFAGNVTRSHFFRDYPSLAVFTQPTTVTYTNDGALPTFTSTIDLQNGNSWSWQGQRAWIQQEKRYTYTNGLHLDATYGGDEMAVRVGAAYDDVYRDIRGQDNSAAWQAAVCGNNPSNWLPAPNTQPTCDGIDGNGNPAYPGYGTGYTAGAPAEVWQTSLVPNSSLANYLVPGKQGYAIFDWAKIRQATNYSQYAANAPFSNGTNTGASSGTVDEKVWGAYVELNGQLHPGERTLRYNIGLRWAETHQMIGGQARSVSDPRNTSLTDGGFYPNYPLIVSTKSTYQSFLPSVNFVYEVADDFQVRFSASRTMTRPNPSSMLPGASFSDPSAQLATVGNPSLKPYYSNNLDLGAELYTGAEGYIGVAAFRKGITGFTATGTTSHVFSDLAVYGINYALTSAQQKIALANINGCNSDASCANNPIIFQQNVNATGMLVVNGLEFNWVQPLDFLTEPYLGIKGFGFTANATIIDQKGSGAAPAIATGVSPYTYNIVGFYEQNGLMVRASYVYNGQTVNSGLNQNGIPLAALYGSPYGQMDGSMSLKLSRLFGEIPSDPELTLDIQNMWKSKQSSYFQFSNAPFAVYEPGRVWIFGVRGTF